MLDQIRRFLKVLCEKFVAYFFFNTVYNIVMELHDIVCLQNGSDSR